MLNDHYTAISTDRHYQDTTSKLTVPDQRICITEIEVFRMLNKLRPTAAAGLDGIAARFLRLGAPVFVASIAHLFNQTLAEGKITQQWKTAIITPVPKVSKPTQPSDFRPISITSVLSRSFEKHSQNIHLSNSPKSPSWTLF